MHEHYDRLPQAIRELVDEAYESAAKSLAENSITLQLSNDDKAERLVDAIARFVIESADTETALQWSVSAANEQKLDEESAEFFAQPRTADLIGMHADRHSSKARSEREEIAAELEAEQRIANEDAELTMTELKDASSEMDRGMPQSFASEYDLDNPDNGDDD